MEKNSHIRNKFTDITKKAIKRLNITSEEALMEALRLEIAQGFDDQSPCSLSDINRKFNRQCRKFKNKTSTEVIIEMCESGELYMIHNSKKAARIVPADSWDELYEFSMSEGTTGELMEMYIG